MMTASFNSTSNVSVGEPEEIKDFSTSHADRKQEMNRTWRTLAIRRTDASRQTYSIAESQFESARKVPLDSKFQQGPQEDK